MYSVNQILVIIARDKNSNDWAARTLLFIQLSLQPPDGTLTVSALALDFFQVGFSLL